MTYKSQDNQIWEISEQIYNEYYFVYGITDKTNRIMPKQLFQKFIKNGELIKI